jgi:secondary thiamine-phosphate synthase enzyme
LKHSTHITSSPYTTIALETAGERFYNLTPQIKNSLTALIESSSSNATSGILHLFTTHTSCALTISEAYDPSAAIDVVNFMKHIAPNSLPFIRHTDEGEDDSPSHMKSVLMQQSISLIVDDGQLILGRWQGIYLAEFRCGNKQRNVLLKFRPDPE